MIHIICPLWPRDQGEIVVKTFLHYPWTILQLFRYDLNSKPKLQPNFFTKSTSTQVT
jgi:hypothetical protein